MPLSTDAVSSLLAQHTDEIWLELITIYEGDGTVFLRWVRNTEAVTSNGNVYSPSWWDFILPGSDPESLPQSTLIMDNVDRSAVDLLRNGIGTVITMDYQIVLASTPDTVEFGPLTFTLKHVKYDAARIEGTLGFEDLLTEPFPGDSFDPARFPGLF